MRNFISVTLALFGTILAAFAIGVAMCQKKGTLEVAILGASMVAVGIMIGGWMEPKEDAPPPASDQKREKIYTSASYLADLTWERNMILDQLGPEDRWPQEPRSKWWTDRIRQVKRLDELILRIGKS